MVAEASKKSQLKTQVVGLALAIYIGLANGSFTGGCCVVAVQVCNPAGHSLSLMPNRMAAVPFKYAQKEVKGIVYVVSFGLGAAMVRHQPTSCMQSGLFPLSCCWCV